MIQYNKWMFSPDHLDFQFPLFTTCMHMLVQFCLATLVLYFIPRFRPRADSISNPHNVRNDSETSKSKGPLMTAKFYLTRIGPCGAATGLDIGLGNMSLKFITLTFLSMSYLPILSLTTLMPVKPCANPPLSPLSSSSPSFSASKRPRSNSSLSLQS